MLLGTGTGSFQSANNFAVGPLSSIVVGDFNGDGKQDLVTVNRVSDNVSVLLGTGSGSFQSIGNFAAGKLPHKVAVADFNGDGKQDLVCSWL